MINDFSKGGIRVAYVRSKLRALKVSWVKRLVSDSLPDGNLFYVAI